MPATGLNVKRGLTLVERGDYYEAAQFFQSLFNRLFGKQQYMEAFQAIKVGCPPLFKAQQVSSASELIVLLLQKLTPLVSGAKCPQLVRRNKEAKPGEIHVEQVDEIFSDLSSDFIAAGYEASGDGVEEIIKLMQHFFQLYKELVSKQPMFAESQVKFLSQEIGSLIIHLKGFDSFGVASQYLAFGLSPNAYVKAINKYTKSSQPSESGLPPADLPWLYCRSVLLAILEHSIPPSIGSQQKHLQGFVTDVMRQLGNTWESGPLLNFTRGIYMSALYQNGVLYKQCMDVYGKYIQQDPVLHNMAVVIGAVHFDIKKGGGALGDLLSGLLGGS